MRCKQAREGLVDYVEGRLPGAESQAVSAHLQDCSLCRALAGEFGRVLTLADLTQRQVSQPDADEFLAAIRRRLESAESATRRQAYGRPIPGTWQPASRLTWGVGLASVLLLFCLVPLSVRLFSSRNAGSPVPLLTLGTSVQTPLDSLTAGLDDSEEGWSLASLAMSRLFPDAADSLEKALQESELAQTDIDVLLDGMSSEEGAYLLKRLSRRL